MTRDSLSFHVARSLCCYGIEVPVGDLRFEISAGLIDADEGCADAGLDDGGRRERGHSAAAFFRLGVAAKECRGCKGLAELDYEIAFEIGQCERAEAAVDAVGIVSGDFLRGSVDGAAGGMPGCVFSMSIPGI